MKKFFSFFAAMLFTGSMMAAPVVINLENSGWTTTAGAQTGTVDGVTIACTNGVVGTTTSDGSTIRIYKSATLTISVAEGTISGIVFKCVASGDAKYGPGCFKAQDGYTYKNMVGTWLGSAASVSFTAESNQVRANTIEVYLNGETPVEDTWEPDTVSVAEAVALAAAEDAHDHFVIGVVMGAPFNVYSSFSGSVSFWMSDIENPTDTIEFFQGNAQNNQTWASLELAQELVHEGDTILVYAGALKPYTKNDVTIYEITAGYFVDVIGENQDAPEPVYDPITVAEALEIAMALEPEKGKSLSTSETYAVAGYVVGISSTKKNTFYLADEAGAYGEFQAYDCASVDAEVAEDDYVMVIGKITHYYGEDKEGKEYHNYEIAKGILKHIEAPQGIENVVLTEKAQKVMVDGVLYIVRDNKMFDVRGAQVR